MSQEKCYPRKLPPAPSLWIGPSVDLEDVQGFSDPAMATRVAFQFNRSGTNQGRSEVTASLPSSGKVPCRRCRFRSRRRCPPATAWSAALEQARRVTPVELPAADILDILKGEVFGVVLSDSLKDGQDARWHGGFSRWPCADRIQPLGCWKSLPCSRRYKSLIGHRLSLSLRHFESMISCSAQMPNLRQACCIIAEHHVTYCRPTEQVARYHAFIDGHSA